VHAWDLPEPLDPARVDVPRYKELLLRAAATVLQPLGLEEAAVKNWVQDGLRETLALPLPAGLQAPAFFFPAAGAD
jgi:hypothetical protein